jgi:hypothetical protein
MKDHQCPICEAKADVEEIGFETYSIKCSGDCPRFEISKYIESRISEIHGRRPYLLEAMNIFKTTHPDSIALIRQNPVGSNRDDIEIIPKNHDEE